MPVEVVYKTDVLHSLRKEMLILQGFKKPVCERHISVGLGFMEKSFPHNVFPTGAVHDFVSDNFSNAAATNGFISGVMGNLFKNAQKINAVWVNASNKIFPSALKLFGVDPHHIIFVNARKPKDVLWVIEEALKCSCLTAIVGELQDIDFTASRRLQLAVEKSGVTAFIHRQNPKSKNPVACVASWKINSIKSIPQNMPGLGFARWNVELTKVRNGTPGNWLVEWQAGHFKEAKNQLKAISSHCELKVS